MRKLIHLIKTDPFIHVAFIWMNATVIIAMTNAGLFSPECHIAGEPVTYLSVQKKIP